MSRVCANLAVALAIFVGGTNLRAEERTVIVPKNANAVFTVGEKDVVRLKSSGIAGSKIQAEVKGPAKITATNSIVQLVNGRPIIGSTIKEFELQSTGKGMVTVTITVTPPQPNTEPTVKKYQFQVK